MTEFISLEATIDLSNWDRAISRMLADAARIEGVLKFTVEVDGGGLDELLGDVDSLQDQTVSVDVEADTSDVDTLVEDLAGIEDEAVTLDVETDTEAIDTLAEDLSSIEDEAVEVDVEADTTAVDTLEEDLTSIEDEAVEVDVEADTQAVDDLQTALEDVSDEEVTITADDSDINEKLDEISGKLETVKNLAIIDFIFNIPENFTKFVNMLESLPGISFLIDTDTALASIQAKTGAVIDGLDGVINRIYAETGVNKQSIADALTLLIQQGETSIPVLEELTLKSLDFSDVWGTNVPDTILAAQRLVSSGLAPSLSDAFDILTFGFQTGANRAGDFLNAIGRFAPDFAALGLSGSDMVNLINTGLDNGAQSASRYGQTFNVLGKNLQKMGEDTSAVVDEIGVDPENLGIEGVQKLIDHLQGVGDTAEQSKEILATFGAPGLELGTEALFKLPTKEELDTNIKGIADASATAIDESMGAAFQRVSTTLETAVAAALDNALDLSGFLQKIEDAANTFATKMQEGKTIGEALEIALDIPEGTISRLESAFNNLLIGLLDAVGDIGEFLGRDVSGIRGEVARVAGGQLSFDLQIAQSSEEVAGAIKLAAERGVSEADIGAAFNTALSETLAGGDVVGAQQMVDAMADTFVTPQNREKLQNAVKAGLSPDFVPNLDFAFDPTQSQEQIDETVETLDQQFNDAIAARNVDETERIGGLLGMTPGEVAEFTNQISTPWGQLLDDAVATGDTVTLQMGNVETATTDMTSTTDRAATDFAGDVKGISDMAHTHLTKAKSDFEALATAVTTFMQNAGPQLQNFVDILAGFAQTGKNALDVSNAAATAAGVANDPANALPPGAESTSGNAQHGGEKHGAFWTGEAGRELQFSDPRVAVLNSQSSEALFSAVRSLMPMVGGGGGGRSTTINIVNNFNTQSLAQDAGALQRVANAVRGYAA